jgi:hypothetical protein
MNIIYGILTVYIWGIICMLLYCTFLIARFYEQKSGRKTYYKAFLAAIGLFALAAIKYALTPASIISGDGFGDIIRFLGALITGGFGLYLLKLMVGKRAS